MGPIETPSAPGGLGWNRETATLALLSFAMLIVSLDQYIVVVALPDIARDLGYSAQTLQSVISAYAVASAGFLLFGGRAADLLGRRRILATGLALYAAAALAGGLATGPGLLLAARAVQGLGGALVFPTTLALINTTFAGRQRAEPRLGRLGRCGRGRARDRRAARRSADAGLRLGSGLPGQRRPGGPGAAARVRTDPARTVNARKAASSICPVR